MTAPNDDRTNANPQPDSTSPNRSAFLESMREIASADGRSLREVLDAERARARRRPVTMTDDCLLPDEAEELLASPRLGIKEGGLRVVDRDRATPFELEAFDHVSDCRFCQSLLEVMQPTVEERDAFLKRVRDEAEQARKRGAPSNSDDPGSVSGGTWVTVRSAWPIALPVATAAYAFARPAFGEPSPLEYAFSASWPVVVVAGVLAAFATKLLLVLRPTASVLSTAPRSAATHRQNPGNGVLSISLVAFFVMLGAGALNAVHTDRAVLDAQEALAADAIDAWSAVGTSQHAVLDRLDCDASADKSPEVCRLRERIPLPGSVVRTRTKTAADLYWDVRGQRRQEVMMTQGQVVSSQSTGKAIKLASGDVLPASTPAALASLAVGSPVVAVRAAPDATRLVQALVTSRELAQHNLIQVSADVDIIRR